jgi:hypothetical protein
MWSRVKILGRMVAVAALAWWALSHLPSVDEPVAAPLRVSVPVGSSAAEWDKAIERAVLLAEARHRGWVDADPVIGRRLVANLRFLGRTGTEAALLDEAKGLGMDLTDVVVTSRLLDRMERWLTTPPAPPDDAALEAHLQAHAADFRGPDRVHVHQVFLAFGRERNLDEAATNALIALRLGQAVASDPLLDLPAEEDTTPARLAARYGDAVGDAVRDASIGEWVGPARSPFGLHLLKVTARTPGELPALPEVRAAVAEAWTRDHAPAWRAERLAALRARWPVVVEGAP